MEDGAKHPLFGIGHPPILPVDEEPDGTEDDQEERVGETVQNGLYDLGREFSEWEHGTTSLKPPERVDRRLVDRSTVATPRGHGAAASHPGRCPSRDRIRPHCRNRSAPESATQPEYRVRRRHRR